MPWFERGDLCLYYEVHGPPTGYPLLLLAPGGLHSRLETWPRSPFDPTVELAGDFRVVAMDQRNSSGRSRGPIGVGDGWPSYRDDQLALLDHLGIVRCHAMGGCIGSSYALALALAAPDRVTSAILQDPIGLSNGNRDAFLGVFDAWASEIRRDRVGVDAAHLRALGERMFEGEFVFSVSREALRACPTPLLVLAGEDEFHPTAIAHEIVELAPRAELVRTWRTPDVVGQTIERVRAFLRAQTPTPPVDGGGAGRLAV